MNNFFPIGPVSTALIRSTTTAATGDKPAPPAKGAFSRGGDKEKQKEMAQMKIQQPCPVSGVVDEFFWIGSSIVAFSKWRLGYMGKLITDTDTQFPGLFIVSVYNEEYKKQTVSVEAHSCLCSNLLTGQQNALVHLTESFHLEEHLIFCL